MSDKLTKTRLYRVADHIPGEHVWTPKQRSEVRAKWDGQPKRPPRKGEWYLSGAIIEAYRASNDLTESFHIANLYHTRTETRVTSYILEKIA